MQHIRLRSFGTADVWPVGSWEEDIVVEGGLSYQTSESELQKKVIRWFL